MNPHIRNLNELLAQDLQKNTQKHFNQFSYNPMKNSNIISDQEKYMLQL